MLCADTVTPHDLHDMLCVCNSKCQHQQLQLQLLVCCYTVLVLEHFVCTPTSTSSDACHLSGKKLVDQLGPGFQSLVMSWMSWITLEQQMPMSTVT